MKKTIAVAALIAASFAAAPVVPAQAASSYPAHCLILPLLKADCRAAIKEDINDAAATTRSVASTTARKIEWTLPVIGTCERAPAGSGHLYDC